MSIEKDFSNINLLKKEKRMLRKIRCAGSLPESSVYHFRELLEIGFIKRNSSDKCDDFGRPVSDGTVSTTDLYLRWRESQWQLLLRSILLPILVSAITTVIAYTLERWLLPKALSFVILHLGSGTHTTNASGYGI